MQQKNISIFLVICLFINVLSTHPWDLYDIYVLAVQWGSTLCLSKGQTCYEKLKQIPRHSMSIHGLWPSMSSGKSLQDCNGGKDIDIIDKGTDTFLEMRKYWPSLTGENEAFWNHEYNKHGYCYNMKYLKNGEKYEFYFEKVMNLFKEYKISSLITDLAGEAEDGEYVLPDEFIDSMDQRFGDKTYSLRCTKNGGKFYLSEIRFKFDMDFKLTTKGKNQNSCPYGKPIYINYVS